MTKQLILAICLAQGQSVVAMDIDTPNKYTIVNAQKACTDEENKQIHNLYKNVGRLGLDELTTGYNKLKTDAGINLTMVVDVETRNTVLHQLVLQIGKVENATFLIESAKLSGGMLIAAFKNKDGKTALQLA